MNEVLIYKAAKADEKIKVKEIKEELNRKLVEVRKVTISMKTIQMSISSQLKMITPY